MQVITLRGLVIMGLCGWHDVRKVTMHRRFEPADRRQLMNQLNRAIDVAIDLGNDEALSRLQRRKFRLIAWSSPLDDNVSLCIAMSDDVTQLLEVA